MKIQIKKLHPNATVPKYQSKGAAGFDFHALEDTEIHPKQTIMVKTGLAVAVPTGYELQVRPRSGIAAKTGLRIPNSPGTVDSDYRGECCVIMNNTGRETVKINAGDRIAQGVICPVYQAEFEVVADLDSTDRGVGGFGSTGKA